MEKQNLIEKTLRPKSQQSSFDASMGMRGWAATAVFFAHFHDQAEKYLSPETWTAKFAIYFEPLAHVAVNLFFIISAFLLYGALMRGKTPILPFIYRRMRRIYPAFLAVFAMYLALSYALPSQSKLPDGLWNQLQYIAANLALLPGVFPIEPIMTVAWTLSYELAFYIFLPFFFTATSIWNRSLGLRVSMLVGLFAAVHIFAGHHHIAAMFVVGMLIWEFWNITKNKTLPKGCGTLALLSWFGFTWVYLFSVSGDLNVELPAFVNQAFLILAFAPIIYCTMMPNNSATKIFAWRPISYAGNLSYSFYLVHGLCIHAFFIVFANVMGTDAWTSELFYWFLMAAALFAAFAGSAVLYVLIERPYSIDGVGFKQLFIRSKPETAATPAKAV